PPFFLYLSYTAPHFPLHALPEDIAKYRGKYLIGWDKLRKRRHRKLIDLGIINDQWPLTPRDPKVPAWDDVSDKEGWDLKMAVYAAQIDRMDQGIGRILNKLADLNIEKNTLVIFLSDNGGGAAEIDAGKTGAPAGHPDSYMAYGRAWANASNTPFRLFKRWVHEGGIATPFIAYWPAVIKRGGGITHQLGHVIDVMATCLDVGGTEYPKTYQGREILPLEGKSLLPIFQGKARTGHDGLFWEHEGNRAVRHQKWKLVSRDGDQWELYDIQADRTELNNLAGKHPETVKLLTAKYNQWAQRCGVVEFDKLPRKDNLVPWYRLPPAERLKLQKR
ncbi:MAG: sulfatase-like hydrolase/transferase, partial [Planctomycetota bacterium]